MSFSFFDAIHQFLQSEMFLLGVLWTGLAVVTVALFALMQTRWGRARPIRKCLILSLIAHLLLAGYAATVQIGGACESRPEPMVAQVEILTEPETPLATEEPKAARPAPWDAFATTADAPPEPEADESPRTDTPLEHEHRSAAPPARPVIPPDRTADSPTPPEAANAEPASGEIARNVSPHPAEAPPAPQKTDAPDLPSPPDLRANESDLAATPPTRPPAEAQPAEHFFQASTNDAIPLQEPSPDRATELRRTAPAGDGRPIDRIVHRTEPPPMRPSAAALVPVRPRIGSPKFHTGASAPESPDTIAPQIGRPKLPGDAARPAAKSVPAMYRMRFQENRLDAARAAGATEETEKGVDAALAWLAANQERDGRWSCKRHGGGRETKVDGSDRRQAGVKADTGVTGLALLAFLGAGNTHQTGSYRETIGRGLDYLLRSQAPNGNLRGDAGTYAGMYCHAMASLAVAEATVLTGDPELKQSLRRAVAYTLAAQDNKTGGWRYYPGDAGDTSQLGWQILLLKSAGAAGIKMPRKTRERAIRFLRSVSAGPNGGLASYRPGTRPTLSMTAEALVCREFLGMPPASPTASEAAEHLMNGLPDRGEMNLYYWYYATLGLHQLQNDQWTRWNAALQEVLLDAQRTDAAWAGSWDPVGKWGGYGGRVYSTAMGALCLEVYYRYQPLSTLEEDRVAGRRTTNER